MIEQTNNALPETVYKYLNWDEPGARRLLTQNELYFVPAAKWKNYGEYEFSFQTPNRSDLENEIFRQTGLLRKDNHQLFERWLRYYIKKYNLSYLKEQIPAGTADSDIEDWVVQAIIELRIDEMIADKDRYGDCVRSFLFKQTGIFSLSLTDKSAQLFQWKTRLKTGNNNNVLCIGLDFHKIKDALDKEGNYTASLINYRDDENKIQYVQTPGTAVGDFLIEQINKIVFNLPVDNVAGIIEQKELRLLKLFNRNTKEKHQERFIALPYGTITSVIFYTDFKPALKDEVIKTCRHIGCNKFADFVQT